MSAPLPETVLQFGAGNFLRAFADLFIHQANEQGQAVGRVVVVQSTGDERANLLNQCGGRYGVAVRGLEGEQTVDRVEEAASISRALCAATQWEDVLAVAASTDLRFVISNTTEAGYKYDESDLILCQHSPGPVPKSFPGKLTAVLHARYLAGKPGLTVMPCELIEDNADKLLGLVMSIGEAWGLPTAFLHWASHECVWLSSVVDRIVPGRPHDHPLLEGDPLLVAAEPYALWVLQDKPKAARFADHPAIVRTPDVKPYFLRKVRILNGAHTALVSKVGLAKFETVGEALDHPETRAWLEELLYGEIVPTLAGRCEGPEAFARQVLERFRNPFLRHRLADIAQYHAAKKDVRLTPTHREFRKKYGHVPPVLDEVLKLPHPA
jgi:tagaturonate reductase